MYEAQLILELLHAGEDDMATKERVDRVNTVNPNAVQVSDHEAKTKEIHSGLKSNGPSGLLHSCYMVVPTDISMDNGNSSSSETGHTWSATTCFYHKQ